MDALRSTFDHPYLLIVALVLGAPLFVFLAQHFFSDPDDDWETERRLIVWNLATNSHYSIILWKFVAMVVVGGAFVTGFYKIGGWVLSRFSAT